MEMKQRNCPICDSSEKENLNWLLEDNLKSKTSKINYEIRNKSELSLCKQCDLVYYSIYPKDILNFYENDYRHENDFKDNQIINLKKQLLFYKNIKSFIKEDSTILDVACSNGFFLDFLRDNGYKNIEGLEINKMSMEMARKKGYTIYDKDILKVDFKDKQYDFIFTSGYFEHIENPKEILNKIYSILKPNGILYIGVPDLHNPNTNVLSEFFPLEHLQTYAVSQIKTLLSYCNFRYINHKDRNFNLGLYVIVQKAQNIKPEIIKENNLVYLKNIKYAYNIMLPYTDFLKMKYFALIQAKNFLKLESDEYKLSVIRTLFNQLEIDKKIDFINTFENFAKEWKLKISL